jgi:ABC-type transport system involved in multi-copper enzyme maturation permease subunit
MMMFSIFIMIANATVGSFILMTSFWLISQFTFLFYGIFTDQIGFVFLFAFNVILTIIGIFIKLDNVETWEENE